MKKIVLYQLIIFSLVVFAYLTVASGFTWTFNQSNYPYFNYLANSFLKRSWTIINPPAFRYDLSQHQGNVYLYWGPVPAIVIMPMMIIFGQNLSDFSYTALFGAINVFLMSLLITKFSSLVKNKLSNKDIILLTLFFAFGTVNFAVSVVGRVWFTSQVISLTPFLISLILLVEFLSSKKPFSFIISFLFLLAAAGGKLTYLLYIPMHIYSLFLNGFSIKKISHYLTTLFLLTCLFLSVYGFYNYKRFNNPLETGYNYQTENSEFAYLREKYGRYNFHYLTTNIKYQLLNPLGFDSHFPFIQPNLKGNGLFITSPLFLFIFWKVRKTFKNKYCRLLILGVLPVFLQLMLFYGTGASQFGARYLLDLIPILILIISMQIKSIPPRIKLLFLIPSLIFCSLGAIWFSVYRQW